MRYVVLAVIAAAWLWEFVAFTTGRVPTITHIIRSHRDQPAVPLIVGAVIGAISTYVWAHLLGE